MGPPPARRHMRLVSASKWYPPPADHDGHHVDRVYRLRLVAFVPLRDGRRRVVAVVERSDFEGELGTMLRRGLVVFAASLLLALFQGLLFSRRLTRPIEVVTGMAGRIARAPGGPWETVPVRTNDEVGELATAFNQMIARLNEARVGLERRIAEATRHIATLYEVARTTTSTLEIKDVLTLVAEKTLATLDLPQLVVLWHPSDLGDVVDAYAAAANGPGEHLEIGQPVDLADLCPGARPTVAPLPALGASLPAAVAERLVAPRVLCLPIVFKDRLLGVILAGLRAHAPAPDLELAAALANAVLFEAVRQKEVELRKLSRLRAELQEDSLRAMSRELHDGFGQVLTVINMDLGLVERNLERGPAAMRTPLRDARDQLTALLQGVRTMSQVLRPPMLDFGLVPTLHWFVEKFIERTQIAVALRTPPEETRLPAPIELLLYRVAQEALTNVAKHARAHHVDVELAVLDGQAFLCIADDGVGFEMERFRRKPVLAGVGLLGMRERVAYYRGGLDIRSRPQAGARITVTIPLGETTSDGGGVA
ncbi:MAG: HAMP domain-containing protein [Deltaproteobacteria bacterium]|nr:MAG: HAMP domain-containing protein [Deltaproteobacteria bacterium]